jgi:hypothetical protein
MNAVRLAALLALGAGLSAPAAAVTLTAPVTRATPVPLHTTVPLGRPSPKPAGLQPRVIYGTIERFKGDTIEVRLRDAKIVHVDASEAAKNGTLSIPLFTGKFVAVEGYNGVPPTFHAVRVSRLTSLNDLPPDR